MDKPICGDFYKHCKGGIYEVLHIALHTENNDVMVVYCNEKDRSKVFVRPLAHWDKLRDMEDGQRLKRFSHHRTGQGNW